MAKLLCTGFVFARGGSKGYPGKNIRKLGGKPLLGRAIQIAQQSKWIDRVVVSTDSEEIAKVARHWGAEVPFLRPSELARDDSPELQAWQHALRYLKARDKAAFPDIFVSLPAIAPFRSVNDIDECVSKLTNCRRGCGSCSYGGQDGGAIRFLPWSSWIKKASFDVYIERGT